MLAFILRRLFQSLLVMLAVALIAFAMFRFVGDPVNQLVSLDTPQEQVAQIRKSLGLDEPVVVQFARYIYNAARLEFGVSYQFRLPVIMLLGERAPTSLKLFLVTVAIVDDMGAVAIIAFFYTSQIDVVALLAATALGSYFVQTAYASGPPDLVVAGLTVIDPIVAISVGIIVLGEAAEAPLWAIISFIIAGGLAVYGVFQLAQHHPGTAAKLR